MSAVAEFRSALRPYDVVLEAHRGVPEEMIRRSVGAELRAVEILL